MGFLEVDGVYPCRIGESLSGGDSGEHYVFSMPFNFPDGLPRDTLSVMVCPCAARELWKLWTQRVLDVKLNVNFQEP